MIPFASHFQKNHIYMSRKQISGSLRVGVGINCEQWREGGNEILKNCPMVQIAQFYKFTKYYCTLHLQRMNFVICKFYFIEDAKTRAIITTA